jgi:hypothetical protein
MLEGRREAEEGRRVAEKIGVALERGQRAPDQRQQVGQQQREQRARHDDPQRRAEHDARRRVARRRAHARHRDRRT